jgi:hypothetical protein
MSRESRRRLGPVVLALALAVTPGCIVAAVAGGAAAGVYLTDRGAEGTVDGSLPEVDRKTVWVLREMGITVSSREVERGEIEYRGTGYGRDVHVELLDDALETTRVTVSVRTGAARWDKDYARSIVDRIVSAE